MGFKWDKHNGADIGPESQAVWNAYIIVSSQMHYLLHCTNSYEEKTKSGLFWNKGWTHYQAIWNLLPMKPKGLNIYHPGWPMTWEENGNNLPAKDFDDLSGGSINEDTGLCCSDEKDDGEEPIPWVSQVCKA